MSLEEKPVFLSIHAVPGSKSSRIVGFKDDGSLKIKVKAKPIKGKANKEIIKLLAEILNLKESDLEITSGSNARRKILRIENKPGKIIQEILLDVIDHEP